MWNGYEMYMEFTHMKKLPTGEFYIVSIPVCDAIGQQFMIRTDVIVVILIINILMLWGKN